MNAEAGDRPRYVAIIMDGNARWAASRGLAVTEGHKAGTDTLKRTVDIAGDLGIEQLTVYAFSTENWTRPDAEVSGIMSLFVDRLRREAPELDERGVRLRIIGRRDRVAPQVREQIEWAEELTARHTARTLFVAFDYGGRAEILHAAESYEGGGEEEFRRRLYAPDMEDPQLIIRTGGELRLSNFLLWESAYAELYFSDRMWPDFDRDEFERAVASYGAREYRFGGR
ncbi:MAG TPA: polyprenyl diphosphate synthase [Solirubrobacterales bacterium]|nr:polyprenyl diphosphate synthase [Solirubrobacterales bacterium]